MDKYNEGNPSKQHDRLLHENTSREDVQCMHTEWIISQQALTAFMNTTCKYKSGACPAALLYYNIYSGFYIKLLYIKEAFHLLFSFLPFSLFRHCTASNMSNVPIYKVGPGKELNRNSRTCGLVAGIHSHIPQAVIISIQSRDGI